MHYMIRIELHHTANYDSLYTALARRKIVKTISGSDGHTYELPTGTYYYFGNSTAESVRTAAIAAATEAGHPNAAVMVSEGSKIVWQGLAKVAYRKQA